MTNIKVIYDETNGNVFGWKVYKNELGEIKATMQIQYHQLVHRG